MFEKGNGNFSIEYHLKDTLSQFVITAIDHNTWLTHKNGDSTFISWEKWVVREEYA